MPISYSSSTFFPSLNHTLSSPSSPALTWLMRNSHHSVLDKNNPQYCSFSTIVWTLVWVVGRMKGRLFIIYSGFWDNRVIIVNLLELLIYLWSNRMVIVRIIYSRINYFESRYLYSSTASILCIFEMNLFHHFLSTVLLFLFFLFLSYALLSIIPSSFL